MKKDLFIYNANTEIPQVLVHGYIGEDEQVDYTSFKQILDVIKSQSNKAHIDIHCGGGDMFDGLAIYDLLVNSGIDYTIHIAGLAASMASVLGISAPKEKTTMSENAMFMTHKPKAGIWGESDELRNTADLCDKLETRIKEIYKARTGLSDTEIDNWLKPNINNWINAQDAVKYNLVGKVIPSTVKSTTAIPTNKSQQEVWAIYNSLQQNQNTDTMNQLKLSATTLAILSLTMTATETEVDLAVKKLSDEKQALEDKIKLINKTNAENLIANAIKERKIKAADKDTWTEMALNNYEATSKALAGIQGVILPTQNIKTENTNPSDNTDSWTLKDWQTKNPTGLMEMKKSNPELYKQLGITAMEAARQNIS